MTVHILVRVLMVLGFALTIGDCFSTLRAIKNGAVEANPVIGLIMRVLGPTLWVIPRILFGLGHVWVVIHNPQMAEGWKGAASFGVNVALLTFVVWNNIRVGNKAR